ncbi:metallophosphoesterase family protein [Zavarzinella formosa]|uniref:metallophosphoesterase family protein n=1 Tax=Zavarzinella formosa TaxID=360055 RepID=UPI0002DCBB79|nr:metallophosphoesterase family protein [Zavarzinella formosa]
MRILLISDIHANWAALEAVREEFDVCLFLGDLVDYGLEPNPCIAWVREHATHAIRGNHDHGAAQEVYLQGASGFRYLTGVTRPVTCAQLSADDRRYLATLPSTLYLTLDEKRFLLVHATPRDPFDEYGPPDPEFWKRRLEGIDVDYVCVGHTHVPFVLQVGATTVINPGSIGLPRDGDPRASYAIITPEGIELKRVDYVVGDTIRLLRQSNLPEMAKNLLTEIYRTGKLDKKNGHQEVVVERTVEMPKLA